MEELFKNHKVLVTIPKIWNPPRRTHGRPKNAKQTQFRRANSQKPTANSQKMRNKPKKTSPTAGGPPVFNLGLSAEDPPHRRPQPLCAKRTQFTLPHVSRRPNHTPLCETNPISLPGQYAKQTQLPPRRHPASFSIPMSKRSGDPEASLPAAGGPVEDYAKRTQSQHGRPTIHHSPLTIHYFTKQTQLPPHREMPPYGHGMPCPYLAKQTQFAPHGRLAGPAHDPNAQNEPNSPCRQHPASFAPPPFAQNEPNFRTGTACRPPAMRNEPNSRTPLVPLPSRRPPHPPHYAKRTQFPYRGRLAGFPSPHYAKRTQFHPAACPKYAKQTQSTPLVPHAYCLVSQLRETNPISGTPA